MSSEFMHTFLTNLPMPQLSSLSCHYQVCLGGLNFKRRIVYLTTEEMVKISMVVCVTFICYHCLLSDK